MGIDISTLMPGAYKVLTLPTRDLPSSKTHKNLPSIIHALGGRTYLSTYFYDINLLY